MDANFPSPSPDLLLYMLATHEQFSLSQESLRTLQILALYLPYSSSHSFDRLSLTNVDPHRMSTLEAMILLLLLLTPTAAGEGARRPPATSAPFRARLHGRQPHFSRRAANGSMPRGSRVPPSAPSRYANYHTLDAGVCDHAGGRSRKP